jgi:hypothetical protein
MMFSIIPGKQSLEPAPRHGEADVIDRRRFDRDLVGEIEEDEGIGRDPPFDVAGLESEMTASIANDENLIDGGSGDRFQRPREPARTSCRLRHRHIGQAIDVHGAGKRCFPCRFRNFKVEHRAHHSGVGVRTARIVFRKDETEAIDARGDVLRHVCWS